MTDSDLGRWALLGIEPAGRFLLERFRIRPDFPLVCVCVLSADEADAVRSYSLPVTGDYARLLDDPQISGVIVTAPKPTRGELMQAALAAGKRVLVEGEPGLSVTESLRLMKTAGDRLGVFQVRRPDHEFLAAKAAINSGRLGQIHTVRHTWCSQALPEPQLNGSPIADWQESLQHEGPRLFDELQQLVPGSPVGVSAWSSPPTAGFMARLEYPHGTAAWIDLQRASLCEWATGWMLEGDAGAYRQLRLMTRAGDGEILSEQLQPDPDDDVDVLADMKHLLRSSTACKASLNRAVQSAAITQAIEAAIQSGHSVRVPGREDV